MLAICVASTQALALSRLAGGWTLAHVGSEALDVLAAAAPGAALSLARAVAQAVEAPVSAAPAEPAKVEAPAEPELLPEGMTFDGVAWR